LSVSDVSRPGAMLQVGHDNSLVWQRLDVSIKRVERQGSPGRWN
jgi:hypothetical protein